jgi:hypothetical protein
MSTDAGVGTTSRSPGCRNFPLDIMFKSTNPHGWPRLVVSIFTQDMLGRFVVVGYGSVLIPTVPGRYTRYIRCFTPVSSTLLQAFLGWITGNAPEVGTAAAATRHGLRASLTLPVASPFPV